MNFILIKQILKKSLVLFLISFLGSCSKNTKLTIKAKKNETIKIAKVGDIIKISDFEIKEVNNISIDTSKILLVDFWATWCGPCIAEFPKLEGLQEKYTDKLQVISISDESKEKIEVFLKNKKIQLSFYINTNKDLFKKFDVQGRPLQAIISKQGKLVWVGHSKNINKILDAYLSTNQIPNTLVDNNDILFRKYYALDDSIINPNKKTLEYSISISNTSSQYLAKTQKNIKKPIDIAYNATPVIEVIQDLTNTSSNRLNYNREELDTILINIFAKSNSSNITYENFSPNILKDLENLFGIQIENKEKITKVISLKNINPKKLKKVKENSTGGGYVNKENNKIVMTRLSIKNLASYAEKRFNTIFTYSSSNKNKYNFVFDANTFENINDFKNELLEKYGIEMKANMKNIHFVEIK